MARRKSSGSFETLIKSVFQTGTTVHRDRDWLGRKITKVKHHDTGKTKTYTHGTGLFGNTVKTVTRQNGEVTEQGKLKKNLFGTPVERATRTNGSNELVKRKYVQGFFGNKLRTATTDESGRSIGAGETKEGFIGGTRTNFTRAQTCHRCGESVSSSDGSYRCRCGKAWGRH